MQRVLKGFWAVPFTAKLGLVVVMAYLVVAVFAPFIAPYSETEILGASYELWSDKYPLGTDSLGRDMLSRLIFGARNTIGIALAAVTLAFFGWRRDRKCWRLSSVVGTTSSLVELSIY